MTTPLLQTKLYVPPPRPELVSRFRLLERLNAGLHRKLTLISAPAGFGKTTLVSDWVQTLVVAAPPTSVAWLSLDESDNDLTRFLTYLIAALQIIEDGLGKGVSSALQSPQPPATETILTPLINEIAAVSKQMVLVLDDYHLIEAQSVHDALTFLVRRLPPQIHLVITTRVDPLLPLARLRARGQLTELRAADLRFTSTEATEFFSEVMSLDLSAEDIAALGTRTEGWIAGLQLAAVSMQGRIDVTGFVKSFTGSHHFVLDYLLEEVLEQQSESVQAFLLKTAVLDRLTGSLCDAVIDQDYGRATLEMLERANLFIVPLDDQRRWYRYHHLFADLLRQHLRQTQPEQVSTLHNRASQWYEQNGFTDEAIEHALRAKDFERAAHLLEERSDALWGRGEHGKLQNWLAKFPIELVHSRPHLCIFYAWYLFARGQYDAAERSLQAAEQMLDPSTDIPSETLLPDREDHLSDTDRMKLQGKAAAIRAFMDSYRGDVSGIIQHARQALAYLPEQDLPMRSIAAIALGDAHAIKGEMTAAYQARLEATELSRSAGDIYYLIAANVKLAMTLRELGQLQRTVEICQSQLQLAETSGLPQASLVGLLLAIWGEVLAELDDLDGAIDRAQRGVELAERGGDLSMFGWSCLCLIRVLFSRGDAARAAKFVQEMGTIARESDVPPWFTNYVAAWQTRFWLVQNELEAASQWAERRGPYTDGASNSLHELGFLSLAELAVLARVLIAQERSSEVTRLLPRLRRAAEAGGHTSRVIEILMLQALAFQAGGDPDQAMTVLERALTLAEPEGFVRIFVDEGAPMARLLYKALTREIAPDYVRRLLAAFPVATAERMDTPEEQASKTDLIEPLSDRELEVLALLSEGLTNPEIASRLFLSPYTVKAHTHNIYGKLGVHNRTQAVTKAGALGILPSP